MMRLLIVDDSDHVLAEVEDQDLVRQICRAAIIRRPEAAAPLALAALAEPYPELA